ncbi:nucleoside triphosphate pyrophosphatase [Thermopetrobacter sp. TC1]|uniref:Maf family protein n=1 Tax=Thermopetrobacter sp. TC1 TaxID=1495045 RepID=UPI00056F253D|nr:Maf family protein [Thermopetrobacter sp. TC1]
MSIFVLGSGSAGRCMILKNAGLDFEVIRPDVDEDAIRNAFSPPEGEDPFAALALALAEAKARAVSKRTDLPVLGADQLLVCEDEVFTKPADMAEARENLERLRGRTHRLISALCIARKGESVWTHVDEAHLTMRNFSDAFLDWYLNTAGEKVLSSVGCYQIEGPGIQLFEKIEGDWFTIVGLPILPFLNWLRQEGLIPQ